jgi:hypothetical protein
MADIVSVIEDTPADKIYLYYVGYKTQRYTFCKDIIMFYCLGNLFLLFHVPISPNKKILFKYLIFLKISGMAAILQSLWMSHPCATPNTIIEPCAEPFP